MNILRDININVIIWKKNNEGKYYCYMNNCGLSNDYLLHNYLSTINYGDSYDKLLINKKKQIIKQISCNIILQFLDENILEMRSPVDDGMQLLAIVSHKIKIPLTNILSVLSIIDEPNSNKNKINRKNIDNLKNACYEMIEIINDVIDIVNLSHGELKLHIEKVNLNYILQQCYDMVINDIRGKNLQLKIFIDKSVPEFILTDVTKLKQILLSLLNNAIEHTQVGGISINVNLNSKINDTPFEYIETKHPNYNILFSIKDTGSGIDSITKNHLESILNINKINSNNCYKHTGLGLIIGKNICNLMNGNIWFKTQENMGSIFFFNIIVGT